MGTRETSLDSLPNAASCRVRFRFAASDLEAREKCELILWPLCDIGHVETQDTILQETDIGKTANDRIVRRSGIAVFRTIFLPNEDIVVFRGKPEPTLFRSLFE